MTALRFAFIVLIQVSSTLVSGGLAHFRGFPPEYNCEREGYFVDPEDCKNFFRCYRNYPSAAINYTVTSQFYQYPDDSPLLLAKFRCGPGTIFDEALTTCNFPERVDPYQRCERKPEPDYIVPPSPSPDSGAETYPSEIYHRCYPIQDNSEVICIKNDTETENIYTYNSDKQQSISYSAGEVLYRCGNPRDVLSKKFLGEYILAPESGPAIESRAVGYGECRKTVFYDFKIDGIPTRFTRPPFFIYFVDAIPKL